jgi:hypothetical protein
MITPWQTILWQQFGAAIDTLENAIRACPESLWSDRTRKPEFWYIAYHTIFFLDYYLSESEDKFAPPPGYSLSELDPSGLMPDRVYSQAELLAYLDRGRNKCRKVIMALTEDNAHRPSVFRQGQLTEAELLMYNMRHVQHHAAQLNLILRQTIDSAPNWVGKTKVKLNE